MCWFINCEWFRTKHVILVILETSLQLQCHECVICVNRNDVVLDIKTNDRYFHELHTLRVLLVGYDNSVTFVTWWFYQWSCLMLFRNRRKYMIIMMMQLCILLSWQLLQSLPRYDICVNAILHTGSSSYFWRLSFLLLDRFFSNSTQLFF